MTGARVRSLYVCYLSLDDPLVETQVVAYLEGLAAHGHVLHLLTFETRRLSSSERRQRRASLLKRGISWHALRYHKRPSLLATMLDVVIGTGIAAVLVRRHRLDLVHARSHVPALMALAVRRLTGIRFVFDIRGLMAEEYRDAGRWPADGLAFRLTKRVERAAIARASAIVVLTHAVERLLFDPDASAVVHVIPCCADVERIAGQRSQRARTRALLGFDGRRVLIYVGKFGGWYMEREMAAFVSAARAYDPALLFYILTQSDPAPVEQACRLAGIPDDGFRIATVAPERIGEHLAAADAAISFIRRCPSKISSSPTKIGEYLASGLPVLSSSGIGDVDALLEHSTTGVLVERFDERSLLAAAERLWSLAADAGVAQRCIATATERLSLSRVGIPRYAEMYRQLAEVPSSAA